MLYSKFVQYKILLAIYADRVMGDTIVECM